tara:strand:+ start:502 stop:1467 length:966 start_codon:yes stop_codon:yes gene_type:complete
MKKSLHTLLLFLIPLFSFSQQVTIKWTAQNSGMETTLYDVDFIDNQQGWAVGYLGKIIQTSDGGETWAEQISGTTQTLNSVQFVDSNNGWAAANGNNEILRTTDGGTNWQVIQIEDASQIISDIHFGSNKIGYAISYDKIFKSIDGGLTWTEELYIEEYTELGHNSVHTNSIDNVYVAGKSNRTPSSYIGTVFSNDKKLNNSFEEDIVSTGILDNDEFHSIFFTNDTTGYVGGALGAIYKMETKPDDLYGNYGWELTHQSTKQSRINEIAFYSDELGADTLDSYIALTLDEGTTWTEISQIDYFDAEGLAFPGFKRIYVVG